MSFTNFLFISFILILNSAETNLKNQFQLNIPKTKEDIDLNNNKNISPKTDLI